MQSNLECPNEANFKVLRWLVVSYRPRDIGRREKCQGTFGTCVRLEWPEALAFTNHHACPICGREWVSRRHDGTCTDQGKLRPLANHGLVFEFYDESIGIDARNGNTRTGSG